MGFDSQKILRASRLSLVIIITFLTTWYFQIPEGEWALITACIVLFEYTTVGGVLTKSYLRFLATFSSAIYSIIVIYFFDNNVYVNMIAAVGGLFVYTYYFMDGKQSYVGILGSVTLTIMLFNYSNIDAAILRPFNIAIGIAIAVIVLRFFYPEYARNRVLVTHADFIEHLIQIVNNFLDAEQSLEKVKADYLMYENKLIADISTFNRYVDESKIETKKTPEFVLKNIRAFGHLKRIYRLLSVLIYHIATEDIRANRQLHENLVVVIHQLQSIKSHILNSRLDECLLVQDIYWDKQQNNEILFVKALFTGIIQETHLFYAEIIQINHIMSTHYAH
jgi:uncharacterized membrane protein YccC